MSRKALRAWLRGQFEPEVVRRRTHRGALVSCGLFAVAATVTLLWPGRYTVGPVVVSVRSLTNPLFGFAVSVLVALATTRRPVHARLEASRRQLLAHWSGWTTGGRLFAIVLAGKLCMTGLDLVRLPAQLFPVLGGPRTGTDEPLEKVFAREGRNAQFERFFERCRRELPADARVLYMGRTEGQLLSYILYPRPVFMHPTDRYVAWIGNQVLDLGRPLPYDDLFPGGLPPPLEVPSLEAFVASRRITHEVRFVESDLAACRIRDIR
ncbi:MAG: hypothetical protein IPP07_28020 [Holophagales bacterium]|jgi:hypothetical protein|nr:hypothetical protein [Holophagales bacterium]MBK9968501.1 hypothetical protein [Holophagales bacterium]